MQSATSCTYPWVQCYIRPEIGTNLSSCCFTGFPSTRHYLPKMLDNNDALAESWNSIEIRRLRREISTGNTTLQVCSNCVARRYNEFQDYEAYFDKTRFDLGNERLDNLRLALSEYRERIEVVQSVPAVVSLRFGWKCNLNCIMCNHRQLTLKYPEELDGDWLVNQSAVWRKACCLILDGGEALAIPGGIKFVNWFLDDPGMQDALLTINTNGMLLGKFNARFAGRKIGLNLSLDSYGKYYEKIRRGSSWSAVEANVDTFLLDAETWQGGRSVNVLCTILRSGLAGLLDLVKWCVERDLPILFSIAESRMGIDMSRESFRVNPGLLLKTPEWRPILSACAEHLERHSSRPGDARRLRMIETELHILEEEALAAIPKPGATKLPTSGEG